MKTWRVIGRFGNSNHEKVDIENFHNFDWQKMDMHSG